MEHSGEPSEAVAPECWDDSVNEQNTITNGNEVSAHNGVEVTGAQTNQEARHTNTLATNSSRGTANVQVATATMQPSKPSTPLETNGHVNTDWPGTVADWLTEPKKDWYECA